MKHSEISRAEMTVRRATLDEIELVRGVIGESCEAVAVQARDTPEQLRRYFAADSGVWLARLRAEIAGCVALRPLPARPDACEVKRLYVRPAYRGMGIADALLDAAERHAADHGRRVAYLDTKDDLRAAIRLYQRRGYEPCERYNDNPQATVFMRRELCRAASP